MKIQRAINIIKKSPSIALWRDEGTGIQMLSNGLAAYDVSGFPYIEKAEELAAILGIDEMDKHTFTIGEMPDMIRPRNDGIPASRKPVTISCRGIQYTFFEAGSKIIAADPKYFTPFDEEELFEYYDFKDGKGMIVAGGFIKSGYILEQKPSDQYKLELEEIYRGI